MTIRREFVDFDGRREPKTNRFCCRCQKDLKAGQTVRKVYLDADMHSIHPDDLGFRATVDNDIGWVLMGLDCAKQHGMEWTLSENQCPSTEDARQEDTRYGSQQD